MKVSFLDRSSVLKVNLYCFVFLRSRSVIDVCEHLVYKRLEYLIFVIKKTEKSTRLFESLRSGVVLCGETLKTRTSLGEVFISQQLRGFAQTRDDLTLLHTLSVKERTASDFCRNSS